MTLSSTEAEYVAVSDAVKEPLWIRRLLHDFNQDTDEPAVIYEDNHAELYQTASGWEGTSSNETYIDEVPFRSWLVQEEQHHCQVLSKYQDDCGLTD